MFRVQPVVCAVQKGNGYGQGRTAVQTSILAQQHITPVHYLRGKRRQLWKQLHMHAQVQIPEKLEQQLRAAMQDAGIPVPESKERWNQAMTALKVTLAKQP